MQKILVVNNFKYAKELFDSVLDNHASDLIICDASKESLDNWLDIIEHPPLFAKIRFGFLYNVHKNQISNRLLNLLEFSDAFIVLSSSMLLKEVLCSRVDVYDFSTNTDDKWNTILEYIANKGFKNYVHGFWHECEKAIEIYRYSISGIYVDLENLDLEIIASIKKNL